MGRPRRLRTIAAALCAVEFAFLNTYGFWGSTPYANLELNLGLLVFISVESLAVLAALVAFVRAERGWRNSVVAAAFFVGTMTFFTWSGVVTWASNDDGLWGMLPIVAALSCMVIAGVYVSVVPVGAPPPSRVLPPPSRALPPRPDEEQAGRRPPSGIPESA